MLRFAFKNMQTRKVKLLLVTLSIVLSSTVALLCYNVAMQVSDGIVSTASYYDVIIGPSGSATQLAMNTMFFTDAPLGTIPYSLVEELQKSGGVASVVPFTMGDSFNSAKIVGTTPDFLSGKSLSDGSMFNGTYEAVVGSAVAKSYGLTVGSQLVTSHGLSGSGTSHAASPLTVVGILSETLTAYDNAVFTSYKTVWAVHGEHEDEDEDEHEHEEEGHAETDEVCAILLRTKSVSDYYRITEYYKQNASLLVINPATVLREVLENVDLSAKIVYLLCAVILLMNILVISVVTVLVMVDAKREVALMRLIGVSMGKIAQLFLIQNALVGLFATLLSLLLKGLALRLIGGLSASMGIVLNVASVYPLEWVIMAVVFAVSVLPTFVCVLSMARKDGIGHD